MQAVLAPADPNSYNPRRIPMIYDLAIVGGGPAGLSAAVTAKNRNLSTVLFDPGSFGLALQKASHITNYLGFPDISGKALMQAFLDHAKKAGTEIVSEKSPVS